jgi:hypothetical protein
MQFPASTHNRKGQDMTDTAYKIAQREMDENRLNRQVHDFFERWAPKDPQEASEFHMQFHSVTRAIYADMQRPVTACLENVLRVTSMPPMFIKPTEGKT